MTEDTKKTETTRKKKDPAQDINTRQSAENELEIPSPIPMLPVRDIVVFNYMIIPLFVGRDKSVQAIDAALNNNRYLLICAQKDEQTEDPGPDDVYQTGTVGLIMRMLKMPDGRLKVLVQGVSRAKIKNFVQTDPLDLVEVEVVKDKEFTEPTSESEALLRAAREQSEKILGLRGIDAAEIMAVLNTVDDPGRLADLVASNLRMKPDEAQKILECDDPLMRLRMVNEQLIKEVEVASMQAKIQNMAKEGMDKAQREYFLREQLKAIRKELGDVTETGDDLDQLKQSLKKAGLPAKVMKEAKKQLQRLENMHPESAESTVVRNYLEWLVDIPWKKKTKDQLDIKQAEKILNEDHYDLEKVKERILEYLSVRKLNPKMKGPILCFVGPPGVGKTSLGQSIARSLNRKFVRMSLGGMRDEAEIRGHRRTYIGSMPGRIIQGMKEAESVNPVFMLDEIDKVGNDFRGDPSSALLEVLDPEQNHSFTDHYLNVPYDLSKVMFVCTANILDTIPSALQDRMEVIRIPGYTQQEKIKIARKYLLPRQISENGLASKNVNISDAVLMEIIQSYTREAGLRNLEREIGSVCRKIARQVAEGKKGPFRITKQKLGKMLGVPRFQNEDRDKELPAGVGIGLAWTPHGGEILHVEVSLMPGKGKLILTGQMGDVMKESAQAALSYAKSRAAQLGFDEELVDKRDIHIHVPAGATPKDGPSAGVTMIASLVSALTNKPLPNDLGMTGEITLRGRILPVGGIKEKILASVSSGIKTVIIPESNKRNFDEIPAELRKNIEVKTVENIDEIWNLLNIASK
ncbi:endopeptidase La [Desulfonatronovibrio magnus]|uniref:endopeptidase La n=1 Tax=Desulfonatronovibrio magnus TaxID=698827 RepID=UPI0005EB697D|nr:endopeptidase La [Desulfonatronovibrio magnus]